MNWKLARQTRQRLIAAWLLAMVIAHLVIACNTIPLLRRGYQDFTIFYTAGRLLRAGSPASLYDLNLQYRLQREFAPSVKIRTGALPYNHPPFEALLYVPLAAFSYWRAYLLWTGINLSMLAFSIRALRARFDWIRKIPAALFFLAPLAFFPVMIALLQGQDAILLLTLYVCALLCLTRGRDVAAGAVLALGLFKPQLAGPIALLMAVRRPRLLLGFLPVASLLVVLSIWMLGWNGPVDYVRFVWGLEKSGAGAGIGTYEMPNLRGLISYLPGFSPDSTLTLVATIVASLALVFLALWRIRAPDCGIFLAAAIAAAATLLVSYHSFIYDLSLLLPVALLFLFRLLVTSRPKAAVVLASISLFLTPLYVVLGFRLNRLCWFAPVLLFLLWVLHHAEDSVAHGVENFR